MMIFSMVCVTDNYRSSLINKQKSLKALYSMNHHKNHKNTMKTFITNTTLLHTSLVFLNERVTTHLQKFRFNKTSNHPLPIRLFSFTTTIDMDKIHTTFKRQYTQPTQPNPSSQQNNAQQTNVPINSVLRLNRCLSPIRDSGRRVGRRMGGDGAGWGRHPRRRQVPGGQRRHVGARERLQTTVGGPGACAPPRAGAPSGHRHALRRHRLAAIRRRQRRHVLRRLTASETSDRCNFNICGKQMSTVYLCVVCVRVCVLRQRKCPT